MNIELKMENVNNKILNWLDETGYPLELQAERVLRKEGYSVFNSQPYVDSVTGVKREFDLLAEWHTSQNGALVGVSLVIECKKSNKPFILLKTTQTETEEFGILSNYTIDHPIAKSIALANLHEKVELP